MSEGWGSIALGTRLEKQVDNRFFLAWCELISKGLRPGDSYLVAADLPAHKASNELVRAFLRTPHDTLLMLDSDADVERNFVNEFRDYAPGWDYDILQAFYTRRGWPPKAIWMMPAGEGMLVDWVVTKDNATSDVGAIGTHAVLIRRSVFERMAEGQPDGYEWFYYPRNMKMSEDIAFSFDARAAGARIGATTGVKAGHISRITTGWATYKEYIAINGAESLLDKQGVRADA